MLDLKVTGDTLTFQVYVQPRSSRIGFAGSHQQALKIHLTAPPADGAANKQCLQLLAKSLALPKSAIEIVGGLTNRTKRIRIDLRPMAQHRTTITELANQLNALAESNTQKTP